MLTRASASQTDTSGLAARSAAQSPAAAPALGAATEKISSGSAVPAKVRVSRETASATGPCPVGPGKGGAAGPKGALPLLGASENAPANRRTESGRCTMMRKGGGGGGGSGGGRSGGGRGGSAASQPGGRPGSAGGGALALAGATAAAGVEHAWGGREGGSTRAACRAAKREGRADVGAPRRARRRRPGVPATWADGKRGAGRH